MAPIQIHAKNSMVPSTIIRINEHFSLVSFLLLYSPMFFASLSYILIAFAFSIIFLICLLHSHILSLFFFICSGFFATFNSNKICKLKMYLLWFAVEKQTDLSILKKRQIKSAILNSSFSAIDCFVEDEWMF